MLLRNSRNDSRKGGKLDAKWLGPYEVVDCLGKNVFKIKVCPCMHVISIHGLELMLKL